MLKNSVFPAYFRYFRPENYVFRKSGSVTFKVLPFCISVQNTMKKCTSWEIHGKSMFRRKSAVLAIFRKFRLQKSVLLIIKPCLIVGIVINNVFGRKKMEIYNEKIQWKSAKAAISFIFLPEKIFLENKIYFSHILSIASTHLCAKKSEKLAYSAGKEFFFRIWAPSHFGHYHFASCAKNQKKTNEPISRKSL